MKLYLYILVAGFLTYEKVLITEKNGYLLIKSESILDSLKIENKEIITVGNEKTVRIWDKEKYYRAITSDKGMLIFTGAIKGEAIVMSTKFR